jgi:uncharacterized protein YkwD
MPGPRRLRRDPGSGTLRLALIPALIGLLLAIAAPAADAKSRGHHSKPRPHRHRATAKKPASASCAGADVSASSGSGPAITSALLCLINQQRAAHGLPVLHENARLDRSAQAWTHTMVQTDSFSHGTNFTGRIDAVGYDWQLAGENVGTGYTTPREVVSAWMASPDHCRNILNPGFADVGTGVLDRGIAPYGASTWTQDFGLLMSQKPPSGNRGPMNACT